MSLDISTGAVRAALVDALNGLKATVDGQLVTLSAYPHQPKTVEQWQAWPVWVNAEPTTRCLSVTYWQVLLTLPAGDQAATIDAADDLISVVGDAVFELGALTAVRPARLIIAGDDVAVPILQYEITI